MQIIIPFFIFIFGLIIGSFLNVVILRLKNGGSIILGRSKCPKCKKQIVWYDNIPLLSFILLKGKCRACHKKISWQYFLMELATAILFLACYFKFGFNLELIGWLVVASFLLIIFTYDLKYFLILDSVSIPAIIFIFLFNIWRGEDFKKLLISGIIISGFFLLQYLISRGRWLGGGDIRLGFLMGVLLGIENGLLALFLSYLIGSLIGVILLVIRKKTWKSALPFGPFLVAGSIISLFFGTKIVDWYFRFL